MSPYFQIVINITSWARVVYCDRETLVNTRDVVYYRLGISYHLFDYLSDMEYPEIDSSTDFKVNRCGAGL